MRMLYPSVYMLHTQGFSTVLFKKQEMEFQFNFLIDSSGEIKSETTNEKQDSVHESMAIVDSHKNASEQSEVSSEQNNLNNEQPLSQIPSCEEGYRTLSKNDILAQKCVCLEQAKEHNVPTDSSKLRENKVSSTLPSRYYANLSVVDMGLPDNPLEKDKISSHSDLISGVYEGGLKIWECTFDLMDYLSEANIQLAHKCVLDLGCGAGLLGIVALKGNAKNVHFQDYNSTVIEEMTLPNVFINYIHQEDDKGTGELSPKLSKAKDMSLLSKCRFFSGEWSQFSKLVSSSNESVTKYDVILTSETVYNPAYYEALHDTFLKLLDTKGCIYLASKAYYFGCGGGVFLFTKFVEEKKVFQSRTVKVIDQGLKRVITELVFKKSC